MDFEKGNVTLSGRTHRSTWDSASYLTQTQFQSGDPYGKDSRAQNDGGQKKFNTLRLDLRRELTDSIKLLGFVYGTHQTYTRYFTRPINTTTWRQREEDYVRDVSGFGLSLNGLSQLAGAPLKWTAGTEQYRETTQFEFFDGTTQRARIGLPVFKQSRSYAFNSTSAFAEAEWSFSPLFRPTVGVRADRYTGDCTTRGPEVVSATDPQCNTPLTTVALNQMTVDDAVQVQAPATAALLTVEFDNGFYSKTLRGTVNKPMNEVPGATAATWALKTGKYLTQWGANAQKPNGLRLEVVPMTSVQPKAGDVLTVQVLWEGKPLEGVKVSKGEHDEGVKTDATGKATYKVEAEQNFVWTERRAKFEGDPHFDLLAVASNLVFMAR